MTIDAITLGGAFMSPLFPLPDSSGLKPLSLPEDIVSNLNSNDSGHLPQKTPSPDAVDRFQNAISTSAQPISRLAAAIAAAPAQEQPPTPQAIPRPSALQPLHTELRPSAAARPENQVAPATKAIEHVAVDISVSPATKIPAKGSNGHEKPIDRIDAPPAPSTTQSLHTSATPNFHASAATRETTPHEATPQTVQSHELPKVASTTSDVKLQVPSGLEPHKAPEVQTVEPKAPEVQTPEPKAPEVQTVEPKAPEVQTVEPKAPGVQTMEPKAPRIQAETVQNTERPDLPTGNVKGPKIEAAESSPKVAEPTSLPTDKPAPVAADDSIQPDGRRQATKVDDIVIPINVPVVQDASPMAAASATIEIDPSAATARTSELTEAAAAVAETIRVTPSLVRGDGEVVIRLKPNVLDGSEIRLEARGSAVAIDIRPANAEVAQAVERSQAQFAQQLAERMPSFQFTVSTTPRQSYDRKTARNEAT